MSNRNGRWRSRRIVLKKGDFDLEYFMRSEDSNITRKICSYLSFEDLKILREVSRTCYDFLDINRNMWIKFIEKTDARKSLRIVRMKV